MLRENLIGERAVIELKAKSDEWGARFSCC
jgi:hypothetical protein